MGLVILIVFHVDVELTGIEVDQLGHYDVDAIVQERLIVNDKNGMV